MSSQEPGSNDSTSSLLNRPGYYAAPLEEDQPRARFWYRRICGNLTLFSWVPVILGTVAGLLYTKAETNTNGNDANLVQSLR